jgi:hypothetical protein
MDHHHRMGKVRVGSRPISASAFALNLKVRRLSQKAAALLESLLFSAAVPK